MTQFPRSMLPRPNVGPYKKLKNILKMSWQPNLLTPIWRLKEFTSFTRTHPNHPGIWRWLSKLYKVPKNSWMKTHVCNSDVYWNKIRDGIITSQLDNALCAKWLTIVEVTPGAIKHPAALDVSALSTQCTANVASQNVTSTMRATPQDLTSVL